MIHGNIARGQAGKSPPHRQQNREARPHFHAWLRGKIAYLAMVRPAIGAKMRLQLDALPAAKKT
jgi:hypothetical protein